MAFTEDVREFAKSCVEKVDKYEIATEEATKTALINPFIRLLGFDTENPGEVVPEYSTEIAGVKSGQRVDYLLRKEDDKVLLIEAKALGSSLALSQTTQLFQYFVATEAKFGLLTDGLVYKFYTDADKSNLMDTEPFFVLDLHEVSVTDIQHLAMFRRDGFDEDGVRSKAREMRELAQIESYLESQAKAPTDAYVRFVYRGVYPDKRYTSVRLVDFAKHLKEAIGNVVSRQVQMRLSTALAMSQGTDEALPSSQVEGGEPGDETQVDPRFVDLHREYNTWGKDRKNSWICLRLAELVKSGIGLKEIAKAIGAKRGSIRNYWLVGSVGTPELLKSLDENTIGIVVARKLCEAYQGDSQVNSLERFLAHPELESRSTIAIVEELIEADKAAQHQAV